MIFNKDLNIGEKLFEFNMEKNGIMIEPKEKKRISR